MPTPGQFLTKIQKGIPPVVLLAGQESYQRRKIKDALVAAFAENAFTQHDLTEVSLAEVIDDARALSLFASERLIWVVNAEGALPRTKTADEDGEGEASGGDAGALKQYLKDPTPGVSLVFEASKFDFEGDEKRKLDRVLKFYSAIPEVVELKRYSPVEARREAEALARKIGINLHSAALDLLVEALGADIARIAVELEKLSLFAGSRQVGEADVVALAPEARASNIFALVNALGRRDRTGALETLDTLSKEGVYLPLALAFLSSQLRMALSAREANLKASPQIASHLGIPFWKADQVAQTASKFSRAQLERAVCLLYQTDKGFRDVNPDDRLVMEQFILQLVK